MDSEIIDKPQSLRSPHNVHRTVTTFLLCQNMLMSTGIEQLLAGSCFCLTADASTGAPDQPVSIDAPPTLILICESLSPEGYLDLVERLEGRCPAARLVVLADKLEPETVWPLLNAGLDGLCPPNMSREVMLKALELVMTGETFVPAYLALALLSGPLLAHGPQVIPASGPAGLVRKLSERETQILRLLTKGASNKMIARELGLAEATIKVHIKAILRKSKAANRTQAAMWATQYLGFEMSTPAIEGTVGLTSR